MKKREEVFERLSRMFTGQEIETIADWWNLYTNDEHIDWFLTASKTEILEASTSAFEGELKNE
jgi:hypothetical protein